jgi:hypothetical protein
LADSIGYYQYGIRSDFIVYIPLQSGLQPQHLCDNLIDADHSATFIERINKAMATIERRYPRLSTFEQPRYQTKHIIDSNSWRLISDYQSKRLSLQSWRRHAPYCAVTSVFYWQSPSDHPDG